MGKPLEPFLRTGIGNLRRGCANHAEIVIREMDWVIHWHNFKYCNIHKEALTTTNGRPVMDDGIV